MIKNYNQFISEQEVNWVKGGFLFIFGKKTENESRSLFLVQVKRVALRKDKDINLATLNTDEIFKVILKNDKLSLKKFSPEFGLSQLGMKTDSIVLNRDKTPLWNYTLNNFNAYNILSTYENEIKKLSANLDEN